MVSLHNNELINQGFMEPHIWAEWFYLCYREVMQLNFNILVLKLISVFA